MHQSFEHPFKFSRTYFMRSRHVSRRIIRSSSICIIHAAVFVFAQAARAEIPLYSIPAPSLQSRAQLGSSVALDEGLTAVGAPSDDIGAIDSGVVKVFDSQTGALLHVIPNPTPAENDNFGSSVSLSGTMLLVGAPLDDVPGAPNAGCSYLYDLAGVTPTQPVFTIQSPDPAEGDNFGVSVGISGTRMVVGAHLDDPGNITDAGSAHVYDLTGGTPALVATLSSPNPVSFGWFGFSVGISGARVVVGAYRETMLSFTKTGRSYVYDFTNGNTPDVITLHYPDPADNDQFGVSVAISGARVVIGATGDDTNQSNAGSVYVYDLDGETAAQPDATINNPDPSANDSFGISVAISGSRMAVGANRDDTGASNSGIAYLYDPENLASGSPTPPLITLQNPSPAADDSFGRSVAVSGARVLAGAPNDDTGDLDSGSAYLYDFTGGAPPVLITLNNPGPNPENRFGSSVAVSGTYMVAGAPQDDSSNIADSGRAYVYDLAGATPTVPVFTLENPAPAANDQFGSSVAISGTKVVIGAYLDDPGNVSNAGCAYLYDLAGGTPTQPVATLTSPSPAIDDRFGCSVGISGALLAVGAHLDEIDSFEDAGSAYIYDLTGGTPALLAALNKPGSPASFDQFGVSVAVSGMRVVVGATGDDTNAANAGSAYVYDFTNGNTLVVTTLNNPDPEAEDLFGISVAISGSKMVVGAHQDDTAASNSGSAYVYDLANLGIGSPTPPLITLHNLSPAASDSFGVAVAISSSHALIGVPSQDTGSNNSGRAYLFNLNSQTPEVPAATYNNPSPAVDDQFSSSVAINAKTCVIGAPYDDSIASDSGAAYVFGPAAQISVEQPSGTVLPEIGAAIDTGEVFVGDEGESLVFTIRNNGTVNLNGIGVITGGTHAANFVLNTDSTASSIAPGASTTFSVRFQPAAGGSQNASLSITSANGDVNPFVLALNGTGVLPSIDLAVSPSSVTEDGGTNLIYTFTRNGSSAGALTVSFSVLGTAEFGTDYTQTGADTFNKTSGTVVFAAESATTTVTLDPSTDTAFEPDETAILTIASGSYHTISSPGSAIGTILNDDIEPTPRELFDNYAENAGLTGEDAEPNATPFNDGVSNLIKYAFSMDAAAPDTRVLVPTIGENGLPVLLKIGDSEPKVHYEFIRRKNSGLTYMPLQSTSLADGTWELMTGASSVSEIGIDGKWERVIILQDHDPASAPKRFYRMKVTLD